jgi:3-hydroxyisobutyrate dehydrogenase-like beta-hydroxyacid dehydrogenase
MADGNAGETNRRAAALTTDSPRAERKEGPASVVGVIGLGVIGGGVARHLVARGYQVVVCDVHPEALEPFAGLAETARDPDDLASACDVIVVAVVNDAQLRQVMGAVLSRAAPDSVVVVLSTVAVETVLELAEAARRAHVSLLDCGVSGGPAAAAQGQLVCMVGGDSDVIERIGPVLGAWSSEIIHTGPVGSGLAAKLSRNVVQYGAWLAAYEGQVLAEAYGVDLTKLGQAIRAADALSGGAAALMFRDTVTPFGAGDDPNLIEAMRAGAKLAHKDLRIALELAVALGVDLPMATLTEARCDLIFGIGTPPPTGPQVPAGEDQNRQRPGDGSVVRRARRQ